MIHPEIDCFLIVAAVYDNLDCSDVMDSPHFSIATKLLEVMDSHLLLLLLSLLPEHTDAACLCGVFMYGCRYNGHVPFFLLALKWCCCRCLSELGDLQLGDQASSECCWTDSLSRPSSWDGLCWISLIHLEWPGCHDCFSRWTPVNSRAASQTSPSLSEEKACPGLWT